MHRSVIVRSFFQADRPSVLLDPSLAASLRAPPNPPELVVLSAGRGWGDVEAAGAPR